MDFKYQQLELEREKIILEKEKLMMRMQMGGSSMETGSVELQQDSGYSSIDRQNTRNSMNSMISSQQFLVNNESPSVTEVESTINAQAEKSTMISNHIEIVPLVEEDIVI
jgi:hypothetical protein